VLQSAGGGKQGDEDFPRPEIPAGRGQKERDDMGFRAVRKGQIVAKRLREAHHPVPYRVFMSLEPVGVSAGEKRAPPGLEITQKASVGPVPRAGVYAT